jgi:hypothetical protein
MAASPNPFRFKVSASLTGQEELLKNLLARASPEAKQALQEWWAKRVLREAKHLVPRDTGQLEQEIAVFYEGDLPVGVGVPSTSQAIHRAWATEYGSWNYNVGSAESPKLDWKTKSKPSASMPWLRVAALVQHMPFLRRVRRYFITGKRET